MGRQVPHYDVDVEAARSEDEQDYPMAEAIPILSNESLNGAERPPSANPSYTYQSGASTSTSSTVATPTAPPLPTTSTSSSVRYQTSPVGSHTTTHDNDNHNNHHHYQHLSHNQLLRYRPIQGRKPVEGALCPFCQTETTTRTEHHANGVTWVIAAILACCCCPCCCCFTPFCFKCCLQTDHICTACQNKISRVGPFASATL